MRCRQINLLKNATNYCIKKRNKEDETMGVEVGENRRESKCRSGECQQEAIDSQIVGRRLFAPLLDQISNDPINSSKFRSLLKRKRFSNLLFQSKNFIHSNLLDSFTFATFHAYVRQIGWEISISLQRKRILNNLLLLLPSRN